MTLNRFQYSVSRFLLEVPRNAFDHLLTRDSHRIGERVLIFVLDELLRVTPPVLQAVVRDLHVENAIVAEFIDSLFDNASVATLLFQLNYEFEQLVDKIFQGRFLF